MTSGSNRVIVRKAMTDDLDDIKVLADAHRNELGFVRRSALIEAINRQEVMVAHNHQALAGFVEYRHRKDTQTTLYHLAVRPEYRRQGIGRVLMKALQAEAQATGKCKIRLKCPEDLPANHFYEHLGYQQVGIEIGKNRALLVWQLALS